MDKYKKLTLEEKAAFTTGADAEFTTEIGGIPKAHMLDGPHGMRAFGEHKNSVCYPPACLTAASFDRKVTEEVGNSMAKQYKAFGVGMMLGPGLNIKRSPLCGRNFEYFSEDPYLAGELAAAYVIGAQKEGIAACVKHYLANNQEFRRRNASSNIDERALYELYLENFRIAVQKGEPKAVMCSYNLVNGEQVSASKRFLTDILRGEWGYKGMVVSDWGAVKDRAKAIHAGCDLTMPSENNTDNAIIEAIKRGELSEEELDVSCSRIEEFCDYVEKNKKEGDFSFEKAHAKAVELAKECFVLLRNEEKVLPLSKEEKVLFVGELGLKPRYQGGGSSKVAPYKVLGLDEAAKLYENAEFVKGYDVGENGDEELSKEAVEKAKTADVVVAVIGLPTDSESEGFDRFGYDLPKNQLALVEKLCEVNANVVVVLMNGSPVAMPFADKVKGILECYLGGEGVAEAVIDTLYGKSNPSGRLPESFPEKIEDNPSYLFFPGDNNTSFYGESIYVGYRYYETKGIRPRFNFGYGLSYTEFSYSDLCVKDKLSKDDATFTVSVTVENVGEVAGKEVLQLYIEDKTRSVHRPKKELKAFDKIYLESGEKKTVTFEVERRAFSFYDEEAEKFVVPEGTYAISFGKDCHENHIEKLVFVEGDVVRSKERITLFTPIAEVVKTNAGKKFVEEVMPRFNEMVEKSGYLSGPIAEQMKRMSEEERLKMSIRGILSQPLNMLGRALPEMTETKWMDLLDEINDEK